jgi:hypothetical protein
MFGFGKRKKKPELDESDREWQAAFTKVIAELVPGEKFEIVAHKEADGATRFELVTESKRAMVAWSEVQEVLQPVIQPSQKPVTDQ